MTGHELADEIERLLARCHDLKIACENDPPSLAPWEDLRIAQVALSNALHNNARLAVSALRRPAPAAVDVEAVGGLTFRQLREANRARLPLFKNRKGEPAHSQPDGSDWALSTWCNAVLGELGELANLIKKIERGDMSLDEVHGDVADELADVATYLDILAFRCGVDLGAATASKFNRVSMRVGCDVRLPEPPPQESPR